MEEEGARATHFVKKFCVTLEEMTLIILMEKNILKTGCSNLRPIVEWTMVSFFFDSVSFSLTVSLVL